MKEKFFYKIKDNDTGLYKCGGTFIRFSKEGKVWKNLAALKLHLSLYNNYYRAEKTKPVLTKYNLVVEKYSTVPVESVPLSEYL